MGNESNNNINWCVPSRTSTFHGNGGGVAASGERRRETMTSKVASGQLQEDHSLSYDFCIKDGGGGCIFQASGVLLGS
ncbi:unnamed protein product [Linum trigynum]|uniref:Uncharacterized protein n=1 Tax=Linum trigynum TaxID=586398 RepID=A0AAV2CE86_9ROSI